MFNDHRLLEIFGATSFQRGKRYFEEGRVKNLQLVKAGPERQIIAAQVMGNASQAYHTSVGFDSPRFLVIQANCSCPVVINCKHAVAVLLAWRWQETQAANPGKAGSLPSSSPQKEEQDLALWLSAMKGSIAEPKRAQEALVYLLSHKNQRNTLGFSIGKSRYLKDGSLGAVHPYRNVFGVPLGEGRPKFIQREDEVIIAWIRVQDENVYDEIILDTPMGASLLQAALASGRLFWESTGNPPLQSGEPLHLGFGWKTDRIGRVYPELQGLPKHLDVLFCDPPCYVDTRNHRLGELRLPVPVDTARKLLAAPPLRPETLSTRLPDLQPVLERVRLPSPPGIKVPKVLQLPMRPGLELYGFSVLGRHSQEEQLALSFCADYGEHSVHWFVMDDYIRVEQAGNPVLIQRDRVAEAAARSKLHGFKTLQDHLGLPSIPADVLSGDLTLPSKADWLNFLAWRLPALEREGWDIFFDESFPLDVIEPEAESWYGETSSEAHGGWFDLELGIMQDQQRINLVPLLLEGLQWLRPDIQEAGGQIELPEQIWLHNGESLIRVPSERVRSLLEMLLELFKERTPTSDGQLRLSAIEAARVLGQSELQWRGGESLRQLGQQLNHFDGLPTVAVPEGFQAQLRPYQQQGLNWLQFLRGAGLGGVLADDMGLGKTIQTLAHLWIEKAAGRLLSPALVVCPTSLLPNWRAEAARFAPQLRVLTLHGGQRKQHFEQLDDYDLILTSYALLQRDIELLSAREFPVLIFDEAQNLKNPRSKVTEAAQALQARQRLALTGTPMENHLGELWSIFNLMLPGYLGNSQEFERFFRKPVEKQGDNERRKALVRRIKPFLLRRTKEQVTPELPMKTEMVRKVALEGPQRDLYETIRAGMDQKVNKLLAEKGVGRSHIEILDALLKLRQVCCDPRLLALDSPLKKGGSAKLEHLLEMLTELLHEGRKILLFSQFTSMLKLIEEALQARSIDYVTLTGETRDRATPVERFQRGEVSLFLISLKAGGVGLNLVAADCVIHFDPWWNPAVERQATDRAYRIGQDKPVFVYKLICEGTVEERMQSLQASKAALADSVYGEGETFAGALSAEDIRELFKPLGD